MPPEMITLSEPAEREPDLPLAGGSPVDPDALPDFALAESDVLLAAGLSVGSCISLVDSSVTASDVSLLAASTAEVEASRGGSETPLLDALFPDPPWVLNPASISPPNRLLP
tara:strand:- start:188 stop:523 length:336 start_codon:yes stop_codon:yes gene_type:complete